MLIILGLGLLFLFPNLRRVELELRTEIARPKCVERLELRLLAGDVLARGSMTLVEHQDVIAQKVKVRRGEYLAIANLHCRDGSTAIGSRQPITVEDDGVIQFKVSGEECRCSEW